MKNMKLKLLVGGLLGAISTMSFAGILDVFRNNEYIIDPNLPMYKEFEWTTWRDSEGGRLAHNPKWFILPSDKYIPKEVSFDWNSVKSKSALERRNAYYEHLCETENVGYRTEDYPMDISKSNSTGISTFLYLRLHTYPVKNMKEIINGDPKVFQKILKIANQNPYIKPGYGYKDWQEGDFYGFNFRPITEEYYSHNYAGPKEDTFREYLLDDGSVFRIGYDTKTKRYLPLKKLTLEESQARYYTIWREVERPEMHKLGIHGKETIVVDRNDNKLILYRKSFEMPLYMDSLHASGQQVPIDWHRSSICAKESVVVKSLSD